MWVDDLHLKRGLLRQQLHVPKGQPIPTRMLDEIVGAPGGKVTIKSGGKSYPVKITPKLRQRAGMALVFKKMYGARKK
jgi:hypothetical protein